jgi:hypothetical protein
MSREIKKNQQESSEAVRKMPKSLSERIAERVSRKSLSRNAQKKVAFLAQREEIKKALEDGWPIKTVWETLKEEGKIEVTYQAFAVYVAKLIRNQPAVPEPPPGREQRPGPSARPSKPEGIRGFTFDSTPKKEDLL